MVPSYWRKKKRKKTLNEKDFKIIKIKRKKEIFFKRHVRTGGHENTPAFKRVSSIGWASSK